MVFGSLCFYVSVRRDVCLCLLCDNPFVWLLGAVEGVPFSRVVAEASDAMDGNRSRDVCAVSTLSESGQR